MANHVFGLLITEAETFLLRHYHDHEIYLDPKTGLFYSIMVETMI